MPFSLRFSFIKKQAFKNILPTPVSFGRGHRASPKELLRTKEAMPGAASQRPSRSLPSAPLPPETPRGRGRTGCAPPPGGALRAPLRAARRLTLRRRAAWQPPQSPQPLYYFFFSLHRGQMLPIREEFPLQAERPGADTPRHGTAGVSRPLLRPPLGTEPPLPSPHPPNTWSRSQAPSPAAPVPPAPYLRPGAALSAGAARRSHAPGGLRGGGAPTWHGPGAPPAAAGRGSWQPAAPRRPAALGLLIARHFAEAAAVIWCPQNAHKPGGAVLCRGGV